MKNCNISHDHGRRASHAGVVGNVIREHRRARQPQKAMRLLPEGAALRPLLGFENSRTVEQVLRRALIDPVKEMTNNKGKRIRARLVTLGFRLLSDAATDSTVARRRCRTCTDVVELIHAGSLIVDDIEDGSFTRRGRPALHVQYGVPLALNAGNWLYFMPLELLNGLDLPHDQLLSVYQYYNRTLLRAHFGQALDLGGRVDALAQDEIHELCLASMRLKTGALMGFAVALGGLIAGATQRTLALLYEFGTELGVALQMFDDVGNVVGTTDPGKRYEDISLCRPSWIWACAACDASRQEFAEFVCAARALPDADPLQQWLARHALIERARDLAAHRLMSVLNGLEKALQEERIRCSKQALRDLCDLGRSIAVAYA